MSRHGNKKSSMYCRERNVSPTRKPTAAEIYRRIQQKATAPKQPPPRSR